MLGERIKKLSRGLRFRLTLSYALFFTLLLAVAGVSFHGYLVYSLDQSMRDVLDNEWAAMKGYLHVAKGTPDWIYDKNDEEEQFIVARLTRVYMLADAKGNVLDHSVWYESIGVDSPEAIRQMVQTAMRQGPKTAFWRTSRDPEGVPFLIRQGVVFADDRLHEPYFVAIGRSLTQNEKILRDFTRPFLLLTTIVIFAGCWLGWLLAGRALRPVTEVTRAAARISGSNFSLRIPNRGADDELDYLIDTFNRMIERLDKSFQQIRQFSTDVSHELRTPITSIRGQLEVALFTAKDTEQYREAIVTALQDVERLSQIVRALLLLAQSESGQVALQKARIDLSATLRDIIDQFQIPADAGAVELVADLPPECPAEVDRVQIERMIANLISNAVKFTPPGGRVTVSLKPAGDLIELAVEDTGCGIHPEHQPHIFERFYRVPTIDPTPEKGLGLGLSFVAWIAQAHGGKVSVDSELNKGSRFVVSLPAPKPPSSPREPVTAATANLPIPSR